MTAKLCLAGAVKVVKEGAYGKVCRRQEVEQVEAHIEISYVVP